MPGRAKDLFANLSAILPPSEREKYVRELEDKNEILHGIIAQVKAYIDEELVADTPAIRWETEQTLRELREMLG